MAGSAQPDPAALLARVADALNACERNGVAVDLEHGAALTAAGYVLPAGDARLGMRWAVRTRLPREPPPPDDGEGGPR